VEEERLKAILESLLFAAGEPVSIARLAAVLENVAPKEIRQALSAMAAMAPLSSAQTQPANTGAPPAATQAPPANTAAPPATTPPKEEKNHSRAKGAAAGAAIGAVSGNAGKGAAAGMVAGGMSHRHSRREERRATR